MHILHQQDRKSEENISLCPCVGDPYWLFNRSAQSAGPFGVIFAPLEPFLEHFGHIFCVQKQIGASKAVQGALKAATPEIRSPFWTPFGTLF